MNTPRWLSRVALVTVQGIATSGAIVSFGDNGLSHCAGVLLCFVGVATYWRGRLTTRRCRAIQPGLGCVASCAAATLAWHE